MDQGSDEGAIGFDFLVGMIANNMAVHSEIIVLQNHTAELRLVIPNSAFIFLLFRSKVSFSEIEEMNL